MTVSVVQGSKVSMTTAGNSDRRTTPGASVLLIEDEPELADEVRLELEASGHSVRVAYSVEEGLQAARSGWAAVLVVDRMLSGGDGLSIVETLRREGDADPRPGDQRSVFGRRANQRAEGRRRRLSRQAVRHPGAERPRSPRFSGAEADTRATRLKVGAAGNGPGRAHGALRGPLGRSLCRGSSSSSNISCVVPVRS